MRPALAASSIALALMAPGVVRAQAKDDVARADALFKTAKSQLTHGMAADACANFAESKRLAPGVGVTLYLADCYQRIGRSASAWTEFMSAEAMARGHADKRAELALRRARVLEPALDRLTIVVRPRGAAEKPVQISCDGTPVPQEQWGLPVPVDPGAHIVVARSGDLERTYGVHLDGQTRSATVEVDSLEPEPVPAPPPPPAEATREHGPSSAPSAPAPAAPEGERGSGPPAAVTHEQADRWLAYGLGGAGVVGLGVGTVLGIMATNHRNQSNAGPCDASDFCNPSGLSLRQQALGEATASTVAFVIGLGALGGGVAAYFLVPSERTPTGIAVAPGSVGGAAGAIVRGHF